MAYLWTFSIVLVGASTFKGFYLGFPLTAVLLMFSLYVIRHGKSKESLTDYYKEGCSKALIVARILILIGMNTSLWLSSGCIAGIIHYGAQFILPNFFLPTCFLLCAALSFMLGSAFATTATMGIITYIIGCAGGVPSAMTAGAIISGVFVGDRCSFVASSLILLGSINDVPHRSAFAITVKTSFIPMAVSVLGYVLLSHFCPLDISALSRLNVLDKTFRITPIVLLPALILLLSCMLKLRTITTLCVSIATAVPLALFYQDTPVNVLLLSMLNGFRLPPTHELYSVVRGGGVLPMVRAIYILIISCSLAALIERGGVLSLRFRALLRTSKSRTSLYLKSVIIGTAAAAIGCNQTVSVVTTSTLMDTAYKRANVGKEEKLRDISFAAVIMSVVVPWTLAVSVPLSMLSFKGLSYMPYMFFIISGPIYNFLWTFSKTANKRRTPVNGENRIIHRDIFTR